MCFFSIIVFFLHGKNLKLKRKTCGVFRKDSCISLGVSVCFLFSGGFEVCLSSGGRHDEIGCPWSVGGRQLDLRSRCQEGGLPPQQVRGTHLEQDTSLKKDTSRKTCVWRPTFLGGKLDPKFRENKKFVIPIGWVFLQVATWSNGAATGGWWKFHVLATRWGKGGQGLFGVLLAVPGGDVRVFDFQSNGAFKLQKGGTFGSACQNLSPMLSCYSGQARKD